MLPLNCIFAAFVLIGAPPVDQEDMVTGGVVRVQSGVTCEVSHTITAEGLKVKHRYVTGTIPVPRDGLWHMVVWDFRSERAEVSLMSIMPVHRIIAEY
ncbi:MAG: hypothetical protein AB7T38_02390 [Nitrospirales bacterium]